MPEEKQDPASTQMFRAFVDRGEPQDGGRRGMLPAVLLLGAAIVIAVVTVILIVS